MPVTPISSRWSTATITTAAGSEKVGLQSIDYKIQLNKQDHFEGGEHLRKYVSYGYKTVSGIIRVKSTCTPLDELLDKMDEANNNFTLQVVLKGEGGQVVKTLDFQQCYLDAKDYAMDINGHGISNYYFTARDVKEGTGA